MFPDILSTPWTRLVLSLALEAALVITLAALLAQRFRSATGRRTIWRLSFVALAVLLLAELSGLGHGAVQQLRTAPSLSTPAGPPAITAVVLGGAPAILATPPTLDSPTVPLKPQRSFPAWLGAALALAGLAWLGVRRIVGALWLVRLGRRSPPEDGDLAMRVQALACRLGVRRRIRVKILSRLSSPIAFGVLRPVIGVPSDFAASHSAAQQDAMLAHELAHVAAFDAVWILGADLVTALVWWHPLAWWARRQLRAASEAAADEASLLVEDGPAALAECLVALGARMTRPPAFGGLGMADPRFRSALGRRVERLLELRRPDQRPWRGPVAWMVRALGPIALAGVVLIAASWLLPQAARAASFGEAFQQSLLGFVTTAWLAADENDAPRLILQGKQLRDTGRTNEAGMKWRAALELDPGNTVARDYLRQIGHTNFPAPSLRPPSAKVPAPALEPRTTIVRSTKARQRIHDKLDRIVMGPVRFDGVPLSEVISAIVLEAKIRDPESIGVEIGLPEALTSAAPFLDPTTGLPVAGHPAGLPELDPAVIRIVPAVEGLTLRQLLDVIVKVSSRRLYYTVEDWGVMFTDPPPLPPLHTRWFKVQTNDLLRNLGVRPQPPGATRSLGARTDLLPDTGAKAGQGVSVGNNPTPQDSIVLQFIRHFGLAGVDLQPPKAIHYKDSLGVLMVRATLQDLDLIEQAVQLLNTAPPQVVVQVKFCEVPEETIRALGLDWFPSPANTNPAGAAFPSIAGSPDPRGSGRRSPATNGAPDDLTGILTPQQYGVVLRALEQRAGVSILAAPSVLTPSGRQAQIKTVQVRNIVTDLDLSQRLPAEPGQPPQHSPISEPFELGPVLDVVPSVVADGRLIHLTVIPSTREFLGYDSDAALSDAIWEFYEAAGTNAPSARSHPQPFPVPVFRFRQIVSSAVVADGQTLVLFSRAGRTGAPDGHPATQLRKELQDQLATRMLDKTKTSQKALLVFITPTIVDPAGNRVHTDGEFPDRTQLVPPQKPAAK